MTERINRSWREQRKSVLMTDSATGEQTPFVSLWQAALWVAEHHPCKHATAKKELRKAIKTGAQRYGARWRYEKAKSEINVKS